jgi:glutamate N-acetyltransferase/amino-acid N-acetyltransferase
MLYFVEMNADSDFIPSGGVTSPRGFSAGAVSAGIKHIEAKRLDLGMLLSERQANAAAVFTTNKVQAAPVIVTGKRLQNGKATALVANSECANACTGERGLSDAEEMTRLAAQHTGLEPEEVMVASTGVIGDYLPMDRISEAMKNITLSVDRGHELARAIMTTDTVPKETAVRVEEADFTIGGTAKGSGMIHPNMATLLCFLTTDAAVEPDFLRVALKQAVDMSFNMVSVDGDTSTNDMVLIMANGCNNRSPITGNDNRAEVFQETLNRVCVYLAREIARDGEGATKLIEVTVKGAITMTDARTIARSIVSSPLVKTAIHGCDPNWGRVVTSAGYSGAGLDPGELELTICGIPLVKKGCPVPFEKVDTVKAMAGNEVSIVLDIKLGDYAAVAWGCDMSEEYVTINSEYTT